MKKEFFSSSIFHYPDTIKFCYSISTCDNIIFRRKNLRSQINFLSIMILENIIDV